MKPKPSQWKFHKRCTYYNGIFKKSRKRGLVLDNLPCEAVTIQFPSCGSP